MMQATETRSSPSTRVSADELGPGTTYCLRDLEDCLWCLSASPSRTMRPSVLDRESENVSALAYIFY